MWDLKIGGGCWLAGMLASTTVEPWWAQLTGMALCSVLLYWLVVRRMPQMEKDKDALIERVVATHSHTVQTVCDTQRANHLELCEKLDETRVAIESGTQAHLTLLRDHVLKAKP